MALNNKKYTKMFSETGNADDKVGSDVKNIFQAVFDNNNYLKDKQSVESSGHLILQLNNVMEELDHLRDKILANETCCAANTAKTTITNAQASSIAANNLKSSIPLTQTAGSNLSIEVDQQKLTFVNNYTNPKTGKQSKFQLVLTLK